MVTMHEMTKSHLKNAFAGESKANVRYRIYSDRAKQRGYPDVSLLFEAIAYAEIVHARNHLDRLPEETDAALAHAPFGVGDTVDNLEKGIEGEEFETNEMYPTYKEVADFQEENAAKISFNWALEAEKIHSELFREAKQNLETNNEYELNKISICGRCGYTKKGEAPERCPICGAKKKEFKTFT